MISQTIRELVCRDYLDKKSSEEISQTYSISKVSIWRICKENGINGTNYRNLVDEDFFEIIDSNAKAYWLGFIAADGYISSDIKNPRLVLTLALKDISHLEKFKKELSFSGKISTINQFHKATNKYNQICSIEIRRTKFYNDLINLGVTSKKSLSLKLPSLSDNLMKHFLRGFVDGDGCWTIDKQNRMSFGLVSPIESFILELRNFIKSKCDLKSDVKITLHNNAYHFIYTGNVQTKRIFDYLYEDGGPWLDRKYEKCKNHFSN